MSKPAYGSELRRGARWNAIGIVGKLLHPAAIGVATGFVGAAAVAGLLLALALFEIVCGFTAQAYADATTLWASRGITPGQRPERGHAVYGVLANAYTVTTVAALSLAVLTTLLGGLLVHRFWPAYSHLTTGIVILSWALPARAITEISIAATRAHLRMDYDTKIRGFLQPTVTMLLVTATGLCGGGIVGMFLALATAECVVAVASLCAVQRLFVLGAIAQRIANFRLDPDLVRFALPQSINLTLNNYLLHVDVLLLASFGANPFLVAWYGTAARFTRELRAIRTIFSSALAPVFARQHCAHDIAGLSQTISELTRWTTTLVLVAVLPLCAVRDDLMVLFDPGYHGHSAFIIVLLLVPVLNCAFGLMANAVVFAGRTRLALLNNLGCAATTSLLATVLIPRFGLLGAAASACGGQALVLLASVLEMRAAEGLNLIWRLIRFPYLGLLATVPIFAVVGDPSDLATLFARVSCALILVVTFLVASAFAGHPELRNVIRQSRNAI